MGVVSGFLAAGQVATAPNGRNGARVVRVSDPSEDGVVSVEVVVGEFMMMLISQREEKKRTSPFSYLASS